jgi:porin
MSVDLYASEGDVNYKEEKLSGDWGGARTKLYEKGYDININYMADFWRNTSGGVQQGNRVNDNLNLIMDVDGEKVLGLKGSSAHLFFINNFGGRINDLVGSNGGIDNIEVPDQSFQVYEAWVQQNFLDDKISLMAGLSDVNSEFYVTQSSLLFLNPAAGLGTEFAVTGDNGPSTFPYTSLGARVAVRPTEKTYLMGAVYDGVPGDLDHPRSTQITFGDKEGALLVAEGGVKHDSWGHFGVGAWKYTAKRSDQVNSDDKKNSQGTYFLVDRSFYSDDLRDISSFARVGFTKGDVERFKSNWSLGLVFTGYVPNRPEAKIGFAASQNANSSKYKIVNAPVDSKETQYELTYSDKITPWLSVQPDLQYTVNPGTDPTLDNALTVGTRLAVDF